MSEKKRGAEGGGKRKKDRHRERGGMEGKKIKQIGMQHTTTGGWNEGGVKLGQLGVPVLLERGWRINTLSLSFSRLLLHAGTSTRASA